MKARAGFLAAAAITVLAGSALAAPSPPNFSPNPSVGWSASGGGFKPPASGAGPIRDDPAHPTISNNDFRATGKQPTFPIADLSNPILQPWTREALRKHNELVLAGKSGMGPRQSCWPRGVPGFLLEGMFQPMFIIQGAKEVVMTAQADHHQRRRIYLNAQHPTNVKPSWFGDSVGQYEGDTLVVDTIGISTRTFIDDYQTPHTDKLHVVERFHLIDGGKTLEVNFHVEDPGAFTMPWDAVQRYRRVEPGVAESTPVLDVDATSAVPTAGPMLESSCAEMNHNYIGDETLPIPTARKPDF